MNNKAVIKGSLSTISNALMVAGVTLLMGRDWYGLILIGVSVGLTLYREAFKLK